MLSFILRYETFSNTFVHYKKNVRYESSERKQVLTIYDCKNGEKDI